MLSEEASNAKVVFGQSSDFIKNSPLCSVVDSLTQSCSYGFKNKTQLSLRSSNGLISLLLPHGAGRPWRDELRLG